MKGYFDVQPLKDEKDIDFAVYSDTVEKDISIEQKQLRVEVEQTLIVLRGLFKNDDESFNKYFDQLVSLAQAGLRGDKNGDNATPIVASEGLTALKKDIMIQEAGKVKNKYLKSLGKASLIFISILIGLILFLNWKAQDSNIFLTYLIWENFFIMLIGTIAGVWLSFGIRKVDLKFEELHIIDEDRFEPLIRILFVSLLAVIIGLLFSTEAVVVKIGTISTTMLNYDSKVALLLGSLLGLGEKMLASKVSEQANKILKM